ncbi:hypothetical protein HZ993_01580 [Rhodoferax sp. AJA081-3]|uniref:sensor histidine kinase n=1 Tax=Rhodoferax sp. AJA081-3 TaxID=2752316 RepID=UPI001AE01AAF|nr:ATP-binding protein [Rhodoferax sp. AJA081-3]QTN28576.1 hypothetical protein HZ993_01580 [Rhodoferax sp. AJA081-3]
MNVPPIRMLTTLEPAPLGFVAVQLTKRHVLSGPVLLLVRDLAEIQHVAADYALRMQGVIVVLGVPMQLEAITPVLWQVRLPIAQVEVAAALAPGWLATIARADVVTQQLFAMETKTERIERQMRQTRHDYNELTNRLLAQVQDLTVAKDALGELNLHLESRVQARTADLALANANLSATLDELRTTQKELVRSAQLAGLGSMVAGIAHELNTPIGTALTGATALAESARAIHAQYAQGQLGRKTLDQFFVDTREVTDLLERNLLRAADRIGQFKNVAVDSGSEARRRFRLMDVVTGTLAFLAPKMEHCPYRLNLELDHSIELDSYPGAIGQVLTHFITNALVHAFTGRGGGSMLLRIALVSADEMEITFSDDGNGVPADRIAHLFEPFFTTRLGQGSSGLGLYIAYTQVRDLLGGRIEVSSVAGQGTCFTVIVPLVAPNLVA